jgi:hypothetical protein
MMKTNRHAPIHVDVVNSVVINRPVADGSDPGVWFQ